MLVEIARTTTPDGMRLEGALRPAQEASADSAPLAILLHGVGGNFYSSTLFATLAERLTASGYAALLVNTRGHDNLTAIATASGRRWQGAAMEIVADCRYDIEGWLAWARERNYRRVILVGHSLGAIKALYAAAHETWPEVEGIAALSPPRLSYACFCQSSQRERFLEGLATAERLVAERRPEEIFPARFPFPLFISAASYLDKYGPSERYNFLRFLARVSQPVLLTYGDRELAPDAPAFAGVPEAVSALPDLAGRVRLETIPGADHIYSGQHAPLADLLVDWLYRMTMPT